LKTSNWVIFDLIYDRRIRWLVLLRGRVLNPAHCESPFGVVTRLPCGRRGCHLIQSAIIPNVAVLWFVGESRR